MKSFTNTILVTGGAGFIGSHLGQMVLQQGNYVICMDNLFSGNKQNITPYLSNSNFEFVEGDITKKFEFDVNQIYNLACPASPIHYQKDPVSTIRTNILGALNILELSKKLNIRVLQASTSEIYGDPLQHPQNEGYWGNCNPIGLRSCYDEGKRCAETLFFDYHRQYNLVIKVSRIFNTYGPLMHQNDGRVVSNFICQALQNKPITIYGQGDQTRSFCYVDDLVNGLILLMNSEKNCTGPINLGNPSEFTIKTLAEMVITLTNSKSKFVFKDLPKDDPTRRKPDIQMANQYLNWKPTIDLKSGLIKTINYFEKILKTGY